MEFEILFFDTLSVLERSRSKVYSMRHLAPLTSNYWYIKRVYDSTYSKERCFNHYLF